MPAGSLSVPSVEPRRVCSNLLETAAQLEPDLKGYGQLAGHGQVCEGGRRAGEGHSDGGRSRQAWGSYRCATVACRYSSALKAATFPLYLPGEACLPFTGLIFLLEPLTIYSVPLPPPLPPTGNGLSLISPSICGKSQAGF
uniref:Uncharacterized protein n=1 Tax=Knipowitschia caucasica TaxID=637954 RepID=A0AAV2LN08_KNICA